MRRLMAAVVLALAVFVTYSNTVTVPFVFDDIWAIEKNANIRRLWPLTTAMTGPLDSSVDGRPLVCLTLAINYAISGLDTWSYHVVNILIHIGAALALFSIIRRVLLLPGMRERFGNEAFWFAWACALLWALHPIQTQAVTYVVQRTGTMMSLFYLLTVLYFLRAIEADPAHRPWWQAASVVAAYLGMTCKEDMITAPFMVLFLDMVFVSRSALRPLRERPIFYAALFSSVGFLAILIMTASRLDSISPEITGNKTIENLKMQANVVAHYLGLTVWPANLRVDYAWPPAPRLQDFLPAAASVVTVMAASLLALRFIPGLGFLGCAFFGMIAPLTLAPVMRNVGYEHRIYLPIAPLVILLVLAGRAILDSTWRALASPTPRVRAWLAASAIAIAAAAYGTRSLLRNAEYNDPVKLWADVLKDQPYNIRALNNLGGAHFNNGNLDKALECYRRLLNIKGPNDTSALYNIGTTLSVAQRPVEAAQFLERCIKIKPDNVEALVNLGNVYLNINDKQKAYAVYQKAIALAPRHPNALFNLAVIAADQGRFEEALQLVNRCLENDPRHDRAPSLRAKILQNLRKKS